MRYLAFILLFTISNGFAQEEIPLKHDSIVKLRFNNYVIYKKKKVGVYNSIKAEFIVPMTKGIGFAFHDFNKWDVVVIKSKKYSTPYLLSDKGAEKLKAQPSIRDFCIVFTSEMARPEATRFALNQEEFIEKITFQKSKVGPYNTIVSHEKTERGIDDVYGLYNSKNYEWIFYPSKYPIHNVWYTYFQEKENSYITYFESKEESYFDSIGIDWNVDQIAEMIYPFSYDSVKYHREYNALKFFTRDYESFYNFKLFNADTSAEFICNSIFWKEKLNILPIDNDLVLTYDKNKKEPFILYQFDLINGAKTPDSLIGFTHIFFEYPEDGRYSYEDMGVLEGYYNPGLLIADDDTIIGNALKEILLFTSADLFEIKLIDSSAISITNFNREIYEEYYDEWGEGMMQKTPGSGNSRLYLIEKACWIKPDSCMYITQLPGGGFIYNTVYQGGRHHYLLDENGLNGSYVKPDEYLMHPSFITGVVWDSIAPIYYRETNNEILRYYYCYKDGKQSVYDVEDYLEFAPHEAMTSPSDFVYFHRTTGYSITINDDILEVFDHDRKTLFKEKLPAENSYFLMDDFVVGDTPKFKLSSSKIKSEKDAYVLLSISPELIIASAPESFIGEGYYGMWGDFYQYGYALRQSTVFKKSNGWWIQSIPHFANVQPFNFGYVVHTGQGYFEGYVEEDGMFPEEIPEINFENRYLLFDQYFKSIIHFDFVDYDRINDLGFGLQVFINDLSFFMTYEGKVLTECIYDEFVKEGNEVIGLVYDKNNEFMNDEFEVYYLPLKRDVFSLE